MPLDLKSAVNKGIAELSRTISDKTSELVLLKKELQRYETVLRVLSGGDQQRPTAMGKVQRKAKTDWNSVFKHLPQTFTSQDFRRVAAGSNKSAVYLRQIVSRWTKRRKIKRVARGKYRKA